MFSAVQDPLARQPLGQLFPQGQISGGGAVLQGRPALGPVDLVRRLPHGLHREGLRGGQTARKGDDLLLGSQSQGLPHKGGIHL